MFHSFKFRILKFLALSIVFILFSNNLEAQILRGPYLQKTTANSVLLRWVSIKNVKTTVKYGEDFNTKVSSVTEIAAKGEHFVLIQNLKPSTKYFYSIYHDNEPQVSDSSYFFTTAPTIGTSPKMRFMAFGDCGYPGQVQYEVADAVKEYTKTRPIDAMLLLGDNAYTYGTYDEFQNNFFTVHDKYFIRNTALFPVPGNHDYYAIASKNLFNELSRRPPYYQIFETPTSGEAGGLASGDESYYAYNYGNVHFISLDSYGLQDSLGMCDVNSKQYKWLQKDLIDNKLQWTVVYFHHPPYTMGSHNSDKELDLVKIRENLVPLLEKHNVDVVLSGHSHNYERSFFMKGHAGLEGTFEKSKFVIDSSSARYDGTINSCAIHKKDKGTIYVVAGTGSIIGGFQANYPHNAMQYSNSLTAGAIFIEVEKNKLELKYLSREGKIEDQFTIFKEVNKSFTVKTDCGEAFQITPSFKGEYKFNNNFKFDTQFKIDSAERSTVFRISDKLQCIADTVKLTVNKFPQPVIDTSTINVLEGSNVLVKADGKGNLSWRDNNNKTINEKDLVLNNIKTNQAGTYFVVANYKNCSSTNKIKIVVNKILNTEKESQILRISPNPGYGIFKLDYDNPEDDFLAIKVKNSEGKIVKSLYKKYYKKGLLSINFDLEDLPAQTYYLTIAGKTAHTVKIIKL